MNYLRAHKGKLRAPACDQADELRAALREAELAQYRALRADLRSFPESCEGRMTERVQTCPRCSREVPYPEDFRCRECMREGVIPPPAEFRGPLNARAKAFAEDLAVLCLKHGVQLQHDAILVTHSGRADRATVRVEWDE